MKLKIGSTYQKAVTIVEKLKEGNASIFICGKSGVGKSTLSYNIIRGLLESGVRIVVIDHRHAVSFPVELEPYVHRQDVLMRIFLAVLNSESRCSLCKREITSDALYPVAYSWSRDFSKDPFRRKASFFWTMSRSGS